MIAPWMGYVLLVTGLLSLVAAMIEKVATVQRLPRRWIWAGAVAALMLLVALSPRRAAVRALDLEVTHTNIAAATTPTTAEPAQAITQREAAPPVPLVRWGAVAERLEMPLRLLWALSSLGLLVVVTLAALSLARRRRTWREQTVDGVPVLVSPRDGPAVMGLLQPRVVIPEWSLSLDPEARSLMLRHELEHLRTRDPLLVHATALVLVLLPWNFPLWWLLARLRLAVEVDCDARVLAHHRPALTPAPEARAYGELLLTVATQRSRYLAIAPALLERGSALGRRIVAMHPRSPRFPRIHNVVFAAGAIALSFVAWSRRPPATQLTGRVAFAAPGWVSAWLPDEHPAAGLGWIRERISEWFPTLGTDSGPVIVTLVRGSAGDVVRAFTGARAVGPVVERVAAGYGHGAELLQRAVLPADYHEADAALFGSDSARSNDFRAGARAPVRAGIPVSSIEVLRLAPGDATPGVAYVFVISLETAE